MKKYVLFLIMGAIFLSVKTVAAETPDRVKLKQELKKEIKEEVQREIEENDEVTNPGELRKKIRERVEQEVQLNLWEKIKNRIRGVLKFSAKITGTLKAISGNVLTVAGSDGKDYTINVVDKTHLRRKFWGKSTLSEFSVGDKINVIGKWVDEAKTTIDANIIRNASVQKRWGVVIGEVTVAPAGGTFKIKTAKRGELTVSFGSDTKFVSRDEKKINPDEVKVGHRVRVKGVWDKTLNTVTEVSHVKDFSLPVKLNPTGTVTPTVTPTITPTPTST